MRWDKTLGPAYTVLRVHLEPGEELWSEPGAMMLMKGDVEVKTTSGGIGRAILRKLAGGESFFFNIFRAHSPAEIWLVPETPGDIEAIELRDDEWLIQDTSYLAHYGDVEVSAGFRGIRGFIAEGELFWLKASGRGIVWINSYGGIERVEVPPGEKVIVDNFHFVAMPAFTRYNVRKIGGLKTLVFGGEGLVIEVEGPTVLYLQTRTLPPLARLLAKFLPKRG
ncbi:hypothetical protein Pyrde_1978 [Pyrodictium delaneyi]|uniref:TIGR00266 family protein n=1 Tax=Pyrodictium delaneyi TaxID=1273541 RepID=A0A0P0N6T3_9CREN|nr:TIGR00266 family protein [Pyrodictium delaneyi]ALL02021.1 hypothetical protein Pyrde_1978 [Pyrodictium delaneyi]OWJ54816.1 TIGR00266 family protein [Pyrodictium delaneyi]